MPKKLTPFSNLIKGKLFSCLTQKRRLWFGIFLFFIICGLISLPLPVWAGLEWLPTAFGNVIVSLIAQVLILAFGLLLQLASWLLGWITSPSFIGLKFTDNPFVTPAWTLVRDLANMGFVIALVAIGLGTALRIGEYQAQKTLPWLIVMALLVNFTPVICGVIIDASNIAMNFFLEGGIDFNFLKDTLGTQTTILWTGISTTNFFEKLGMAIVMIAYNFFAALILFLFAFLFAVRYVVLWILVILSPLAFFAYVLPATRRYWSMWWNYFIQWCFIGVVAAFWLYLSEQIMMVTNLTSPAPPSQQFGGLSAIFSYTIPIIFLFMGLGAALSSAAPVAGAITGAVSTTTGQVKGAVSKAKTAGKLAGGAGLAGLKAAETIEETIRGKPSKIRAVRESTKEALKEGLISLSKIPAAGEGELGIGGIAKRAVSGTILELARRAGRAELEKEEAAKKEIEDAEKEVEKAAVDMVISKFRSAKKWTEKVGYLNRLAKQGDIDKAIDKGLTAEEIGPTFLRAKQYEAEKDIISVLPELDEERLRDSVHIPSASAVPISALSVGQRTSLVQLYKNEIISKIKPQRAGQISKKVLSNEIVVEAILRSWDGRHLAKFLDVHGAEGAEVLEDAITRLGGATWLQNENPKLYDYIQRSPGARGLIGI